MTFFPSPSYSKMSHSRGKTSGWAAYDQKQREKQGLKPDLDGDPYPPMSNKISAGPKEKFQMNNHPPRSFASVVRTSIDSPMLVHSSKNEIHSDNSARKLNNQFAEEISIFPTLRKLKMLHSWADDSLIEDTLAAVNNDENQASTLLKAMVTSETKCPKANISRPDKQFEQLDDGISENQTSNSTYNKLVSGNLFTVPIEPEWEEDDIYLSHRRDAIKVMRSAPQHSCAASNAFMRGDHILAQELSMRARAEWLTAQELNSKAAKKILHIRNSTNDVWKLDLHGLHGSEAVDALKEHLHRIETQMPMNRSASSDSRTQPLTAILHSPSVEYAGDTEIEKYKLFRERPRVLQVITGIGNHSRGQAALPVAVRSFLIENGYRFDDSRPGVLSVWPKFRHR